MAGSTRKGYHFEKETEALAGKYGRRVPMSGAVGAGIPQLSGDVIWNFPWMGNEVITVECKHGYGDESKAEQKSFRIHREWFDRHNKVAKSADLLPVWAMKFKGVQENGMSKFVLIPFPVMERILKHMENIHLELEEVKSEQAKRNKTKHS